MNFENRDSNFGEFDNSKIDLNSFSTNINNSNDKNRIFFW